MFALKQNKQKCMQKTKKKEIEANAEKI